MSAQEDFDNKYITSMEICRTHGVSRFDVMYAAERGALPGAVEVGRMYGRTAVRLWVRDDVAPFLTKWVNELKARRASA